MVKVPNTPDNWWYERQNHNQIPRGCEAKSWLETDCTKEPVGGFDVPVNQNPPLIDGTGQAPTELSLVTPGVWDPVPNAVTYQWYRDGLPLEGETDTTLTATRGGSHVLREGAVGNDGTAYVLSNARLVDAPPVSAPVNTTPPLISGNNAVTGDLTASAGTWSGTGPFTYAYQWKTDGNPVDGATGTRFTKTLANNGQEITCDVTATNAGGDTTTTSNAIQLVTVTAPVNTSPPVISGTPALSGVLILSKGEWSGYGTIGYAYQWKADGVDMPGAINTSFTKGPSNNGQVITCEVTATNVLGSSAATSNAIQLATETAPINTSPPVISGTTSLSGMLTTTTGGWTGADPITYTYQWKADGQAVSGATGASFTKTLANNGQEITCDVTATNPLGSVSATSNAIQLATETAPVNVSLPVVSGDTSLSGVLTVSDGAWSGLAPISYGYQWLADGEAIEGATSDTYVKSAANNGQLLSCAVTAMNALGNSTRMSNEVQLISGLAPANTQPPVISGDTLLAGDLTVADGLWTGTAPITFTRQWQANGVDLEGETGTTLAKSADLAGKAIRCAVTGTNGTGSATGISNVITLQAANAPANTSPPVISGGTSLSGDMTVDVGTWSGTTPIDYAYQWLADGAPISGATDATYTKTLANSGQTLSCRVTATNDFGEATALSNMVPLSSVPAPVNDVPPIITGTIGVSGVLTLSSVGEWTGEPPLTYTQQWRRNGTAIPGATGTTYTKLATDAGATITCAVTATNVVQAVTEASNGILIEASDIVQLTGFYDPDTQAEFFKPRFHGTGDWAYPDAEINWTTSIKDPIPETEVEVTIATGETTTVNGVQRSILTTSHRDGPDSTWAKFRASGDERINLFLVRGRATSGAAWSAYTPPRPPLAPAARVLPALPTGVDVTPGVEDGQIIMAADPFTDFGDGEPGELKMWTSATGEVSFVAGVWQLPAATFGRNVEVRVYAVDNLGFTGPAVSQTVLVPGEIPVVPQTWKQKHLVSQAAAANPTLYRVADSAHQIQFCHGGVRSKIEPDKAIFIEDVGGIYLTENADDARPQYRTVSGAGCEGKNSVSAMFDPDIPGRFVYAVGEYPNSEWTKPGKRLGIYVTEDDGDNFTLAANVFFESEFSDINSRTYRQVINYAPSDHNRWYALSPKYALHRSDDRGDSWTLVNGSVGAIGQANYLQVDAFDKNKVRVAGFNGLFISSNGGASFSQVSAMGLPGGHVSHIEAHPTNGSEWIAVVYGVGAYKTTNNGASFTRINTPTPYICQIFYSPADPAYMWYMGINRTPDLVWGRSTGGFSTNGGASWTTCTTDGYTYGIVRGTPDLMRAEGAADRDDARCMQCVVLPSPTVAGKAVGTWGHCLWGTQNGLNWTNESDGSFSNHAGGDTNQGSMEFWDNWIMFSAFDKKGFITENAGELDGNGNLIEWWYQAESRNSGTGEPFPVGLAISKHATSNKCLMALGYYHPNPGSILLSYDMFKPGNSNKRPSFFEQNYGANDFQKWCHFHKTGAPNVAYCTTAISFDEGETWQKWGDRDTSGFYWGFAGDPADRNSRAGVRQCSHKNNDWLVALPKGKTGGMALSKDRGLTWRKFTDDDLEDYGCDNVSLWMDPTDENIIYWWKSGTGLIRYDERTQQQQVCPGTQYLSGLLAVHRVRSSYQTPDHIYLSNRANGKEAIYRSVTGWQGAFENITGLFPRCAGNQGFEINRYTGEIWVNGTLGSRIHPAPDGGAPVDPPVNVTLPSISGDLQEGAAVSVQVGTWENSPTSYDYSWRLDGMQFAGTSTANIPSDAGGKELSCIVTATNAGGSVPATATGGGLIEDPTQPIDPAFFLNPTREDSAWRMPIADFTTKTFEPCPEMASSGYEAPTPTFGIWEDLSCPVVDGSAGKTAKVYYNFDVWQNLFDGTWQQTGNTTEVEDAIRAGSSPNFPVDYHIYVTVTASPDGEQRILPDEYDPRADPATAPREIWVPTDTASLVTSGGTDSIWSCRQPDGRMFESYCNIILSNGDIVCWTYKLTDPSLGGDGWQNGTRATMIPLYAGAIRRHEFDAAIAAGQMAEGPAKEAALEAAIPHAIAVYVPPVTLANFATHPAVTVDKGALSESPPYSGSQGMGTRFALPAGTDVTGEGGAMNLWDPLGRAIAHATLKYGWISMDRSGGGIILATDPDILPDYPYEWGRMSDLYEIRNRLQRVVNITGPFVSPGEPTEPPGPIEWTHTMTIDGTNGGWCGYRQGFFGTLTPGTVEGGTVWVFSGYTSNPQTRIQIAPSGVGTMVSNLTLDVEEFGSLTLLVETGNSDEYRYCAYDSLAFTEFLWSKFGQTINMRITPTGSRDNPAQLPAE